MISNSNLTIYHKTFDNNRKKDNWERTVYENIWWFGGKGGYRSKGFEDANDVEVRIPLSKNINTSKIAIGDLLVKGTSTQEIDSQTDLKTDEVYTVMSISINDFGINQHIHLGGK